MVSKIALRYLDGKDKISLLNEVLDLSDFEDNLEKVRASLGKERNDFSISIKPNGSMFVRRDDEGVTTDPILVLALVERLHEKGYSKISVVESSNAYDLTFSNRNAITVMTAMGLNGGVHGFTSARTSMESHVASSDGTLLPFQLVDLGAETTEVKSKEMNHGSLKLSTAWLNSDFRISFAKFKTHVYGGYTLLIKNTYGSLPETDKMLHYHKKTGCAMPTIAQLKACPIHFGIIDGITAADGWMGVKWDRAIPRRPGFIISGSNIGETEKIACQIMGVDVDGSLMTKAALEFLSEPAELDGEIRPLEKWRNVPKLIYSGFPTTERFYNYYKFQQTVSDGIGTPPFRRKPVGLILTYVLIIPVLLYAFHRRHLIFRKISDLKLRWKIKSEKKAPRRVRVNLDRLELQELELLLECLNSNLNESPKIYGHKVNSHGKWFNLPDSTFSKLVRIPEIIDSLKEESEISNCKSEVKSRIKVLKGIE